MQTRAFLVEWLGRISEILRFPCKWKTARHCQGLKDAKYAGQNCAEVMAGEVLGFLFPLQAHDVSTVSMKDIWSWSTMKYWKRLEIAAVLLPCKRSNMEQSLCTVMHIETRQNKAKQMNINLVNTTYTCTTGVTTRHKVCTLPENTVPSTSLSHGHDYLEVHVGSSPSPESQLPREKLLLRLAWPKSKRLRKEWQHKQKSKCSQVQLKTELAKIPKQLCFSRLQTLRYWYADAVTGNLLMHTLAITQCQVTLISFLEIQTTFFHVMRWFLIWLICLLRQIFFALKPAIFQSLDVV